MNVSKSKVMVCGKSQREEQLILSFKEEVLEEAGGQELFVLNLVLWELMREQIE